MLRPCRPRPVLAALAVLALTACSSAVDSAPAVPVEGSADATGDTGAASTDQPTSTSAGSSTTIAAVDPPTTTAPPDDDTTDDTTSDESGPAADEPAGADEPADEPPPTGPVRDVDLSVTPPDPPLVAVWQESGADTRRAQEFLLELGFWLAAADGEYEVSTAQAVMAFQKYVGIETDGRLGPQTADALNATTERAVGRSNGGTLVEVDKSKQLLFVIRDGVTEWVLNTSTGSEIPYREPDQNTPGEFIEDDSITRPGVFAVNREREEGWWEGDLGEIYRPKYFDGGIALHGSYSIPDYPASHGCVRLSIPAMDWIWENDIVPMGTTVWVHGEIPRDDEATADA